MHSFFKSWTKSICFTSLLLHSQKDEINNIYHNTDGDDSKSNDDYNEINDLITLIKLTILMIIMIIMMMIVMIMIRRMELIMEV